MFIVRPDVIDEDVDKLIAGFEATVTNGGGAIKSVEKMGRRKLAYIVRKFNDGNYILLTVEAEGGLIAELERRLRVSEQVIKFITVRTDEEDKRIAKIKAIRGTRVKRSAEVSPAQSAPAQPVAAQPAPAAPAPVESASVEPAPVESVPAAETAEPVQASA
jgi:small subunit ribosomal protein S6